jgi:hypothetical protein
VINMKKYLIPALLTSVLLILAVGISMELSTLLDSHVCDGACRTGWGQYMSLLWAIFTGLIGLIWTLFTTIGDASPDLAPASPAPAFRGRHRLA